MKNVLIVSALHQETAYIADYIKDRKDWEEIGENNYINAIKDVEIRVKVLGVGKVNAAFQTADAINDFKPDLIVNIGVAGGLADDLDRGAVAIGTDYVQVDLKTFLPENAPVIEPTKTEIVEEISSIAERNGFDYRVGRIATGDFVLYEGRKRRAIKRKYNPVAFDMETAAVAQVASAKGIDFVGIRSFSDMANRKTIGLLSKKHEPSEEEKKLREKVFRIPAQLVIDYLE